MVSSHRIPTITILCIFIGAIQQVSQLGRGRENTKKATENDIERRACSQKKLYPSHKFFFVLFSVTQSLFLLGLSWSPDVTASIKKSTSKKQPTSISEITISYLHKNIIPLLFQCGLFIHTCVSKSSVVSQDLIFYLFWYNMLRCSSHIYKKSSFLSFYNFLVKFSE